VRRFALLLLVLAGAPLYAHLDGRIQHEGIPSLTAEVGIERQFFLYNAPVHEYISLNFGYGGTRYEFHGLTLGASFQWLDAEKAAGILRVSSMYLVDRKAAAFIIGGWGEAGLTAGGEKTGFAGGAGGQFYWSTKKDMFATVNLRAGIYIVPLEEAQFTIQPGVGYNFFTNDTFFFDITFAVEIYLWN
jgi:hypothetical protein